MRSSIQQVAEVTSTPATYAASAFTVIAGLELNEWLAVSGIILGIMTFAVNWYYNHKRMEILRKRHDR